MKLNKRGISLIVLVITIIVMIILASAIILSLSNSGIIGRANTAKTKSDNANMLEAANLALAEYELEKQLGDLEPANQSAEDYVKDKLEGDFTEDMLEHLSILDDGTIQLLPTIPDGFVVSQIDGENKISEGLVVYALKENEDEEDINWTEEDTTTVPGQTLLKVQTERDQYVWVPVEGAFERVAWNNENVKYNLTVSQDYDLNNTAEANEYAALKASVEKNGGFYIARYEAGTPSGTANYGQTAGAELSIPLSRKGVDVWKIPWDANWSSNQTTNKYGSWDNPGAPKVARNAYNTNVKSHLIYGAEWDAALKFIEDNEHDVTENSSAWGNTPSLGNFGTEGTRTTGYSEQWKAKNIYDMAGNMTEWSMDTDDTYNPTGLRFRRGGGSYDPSFASMYHTDSYLTMTFAFRVALYIK